MKKSILLVLSLFVVISGYALSGIYTVGPSGSNYANLAAVATALNGNTITADCVFELQSDYTETPASTITFTTWTGNNTFHVTIRPASGVVSMLTTAGDPRDRSKFSTIRWNKESDT